MLKYKIGCEVCSSEDLFTFPSVSQEPLENQNKRRSGNLNLKYRLDRRKCPKEIFLLGTYT